MAVNEQTISALDTLNQILGREWQGREADKDRGLKIAGMKIASDERELDRLNIYVSGLEKKQDEMDKEWRDLTGIQNSLNKLQEDSGIKNTDAQGLLELNKKNIAVDRGGLDERLSSVNAKRASLIDDRRIWAKTKYDIAPEAYESYRGKDYKVDAAEWDQMAKDLGFANVDTRASQVMEAGLRKSFETLEAQQYGIEQVEAKSALENRKVVADELRARTDRDYKMGLLGLQQYKASLSVGGSDGVDAPDIKQDINDYKQWRDATMGYGKTREMDVSEIAGMPDVLTSATQVSQARDAISVEVGRLFSAASDWDWQVPDEVQGYEDEFKDADTIEQQVAAGAKIARFLKEYGDTKDIMSDKEAKYLDVVLRGYDILNRAQSKLELQGADPKEFAVGVDELTGIEGGEIAPETTTLSDLAGLMDQSPEDIKYNLDQLNTRAERDSARTNMIPDALNALINLAREQAKKPAGSFKMGAASKGYR